MAHTNNTPINPAAQLRSGTAPGTCSQVLPLRLAGPHPAIILQPLPREDVSFVAAQAAAREWADEALVLGQAGDTEQSRYARFQAEAWLVRMLALEAQTARLEQDKLPKPYLRAQRRSPTEKRQEGGLDNTALRTWLRSRRHEAAE